MRSNGGREEGRRRGGKEGGRDAGRRGGNVSHVAKEGGREEGRTVREGNGVRNGERMKIWANK